MKYGELSLGQIEALVNKLGGMDGVHRILAGELEVVAKVQKLLALMTTTEVLGIAEFVAREKFRERQTTDGVKIAWLGSNFEDHFLGKKETSVVSVTLRIQKLLSESLDAPILAELGDTAETTLSHMWEMLKKQGAGQEGDLLVNGRANIFYVRDEDDVLWAVDAHWYADDDGWHVVAGPVTDQSEWRAGNQVVSR